MVLGVFNAFRLAGFFDLAVNYIFCVMVQLHLQVHHYERHARQMGGEPAGAPLDFGRGRWLDLDRGIVTATPAVHAALLQAIKEVSGGR